MASETFVSAMLLVTGVVAAAILIVAVLPAIWSTVGTFSSASAATDRSMRTDFKIVTTYAKASLNPEGDIYIKNIGTSRISLAEINRSDVFFGKTDTFTRLSFTSGVAVAGQWGYVFTAGSYDTDSNRIWDTGETIKIIGIPTTALVSGDPVYFQFILPNGVQRSIEFTVS